jgi:glycosyltransferase involved in cell wall biosynthesis
MARVLLYGNALFARSGYGTQANQLARQLRAHGHDVACAAFWGLHGMPLNFEGFTIFPGSGEDPWAQDVMGAHYRNFQADLLVTLMDAWVLDPAKLAQAQMNVAHWMPIDCSPLSAMDRRVLREAGGAPVAMSRFGEAQLLEAGFDPYYAPHALDMSLWKPLPDDERAAVREQLGFRDRFVICLNAANQDPFRKGFGEQLAAFARLAKRHDDALMLIHARAESRQGINLTALIDDLGLQGRAVLGDQYQIAAGLVPDEQMARWHAIPDLCSNVSWGEGFGLAVLQSQAAGTPVVVNDFSAMAELCGAGWKIGGQRFWNKGHEAVWQVPFIHEIEAAYEEAYDGGAAKLREEAREFALAYDARKVFRECWAPILSELVPGA